MEGEKVASDTGLVGAPDVAGDPTPSVTANRSVPADGGGRFGFSGHQTFPFRYGWLKKAVDAVVRDPEVFRQDNALVRLGVGKNMVESIRHWGLATQVLQDSDRGRVLTPTGWGRQLFVEGDDPYLEDPASLWLIHWLLVTNPAKAGTWFLAFNRFPYPEFRKDMLVNFVVGFAQRHGIRANPRTIERDVDCFVRTYTPSRTGDRQVPEDSFNCPLVELGALQALPDGATYQFVIGPKPTLTVEIVGIVLLHFFDLIGNSRHTLSLQECLYQPYSPGQVFKLDESSLMGYLDQLEELTTGAIAVDETAGLKQLYRRTPVDPRTLLRRYYGEGA